MMYASLRFIPCLMLLFLAGCGAPTVVNEDAYQLNKALYAVCNLKQSDRLKVTAELVTQSRREGKISESEFNYLSKIISKAENKNWDSAMRLAREGVNSAVK